MFNKFSYKTAIASVILGSSLIGCAPVTKNHGNMVKDYQIERIQSGNHTKQSILKILGSPSTKDPFNENVWYYIGQTTEKYGIARPEIVEQKILIVRFDENGKVLNAKAMSPETMEDLSIVDKKTPTGGTEKNLLEEFLGNLGRFNQPVGPTTNNDGVGGPGLPDPGR